MITVSLETAKKLKAAGFPQKTALAYVKGYSNFYDKEYIREIGMDIDADAPTTDEMLADLPKTINGYANSDNKNVSYVAAVFMGEDTYFAGYTFYGIELIVFKNKLLPEALASLWLWAKANGYIKAEKAKEGQW